MMNEAQKNKWYIRFSLIERIEHFVLILSFTTLALTGLPQKYALNGISQAIIAFFGGIDKIRIVHHIAAAVFIVEAVYHLVAIGYKVFVKNRPLSMLPGIKDGVDAFQWLGYNLGFVKKLPKMPRFNFMEKMEYWALIWGLIVMALTGMMLWNPIFTTRFLPGDFIPAAKAAHGGEAVLAVLAILLWHFYNVHIKHWNWAMIKGIISRHEMEEEHGQELEQIESGKIPPMPSLNVAQRRMSLYAPVAALVSIVLIGGVYYFLTFETTSVTTLPPAEQVQVYVPATATPFPTAVAGQAAAQVTPGTKVVAFNGTIDKMLAARCGNCHGAPGGLGGFTSDSYQSVIHEIVVGSPEDSRIVQVQKIGTHPGQLNPEELNLLIAWIQAGAPESAEAATPAATGPETWDSGIAGLFNDNCAMCHGTSGGFTATSYSDVLKMLKPGDPDNSMIVQVQQKGGHPGTFSAANLQRVINWIKDGAKEK